MIGCKVVYRDCPREGAFKYNSNGVPKGNPKPCFGVFCISSDTGDLVYAESRRFEDNNNLMVEVVALRFGLEYCIQQNYFSLALKTDSLTVNKVLDDIWEAP